MTWGGGGWGDPLARDPALVGLEVRRGLVTAEGARRYGVVCDDAGKVDAAACAALRAELGRGREEPLPTFNMGPPLATILERCLEETGLPAPRAPVAWWAGCRHRSTRGSGESSGPGARPAVLAIDLMRAYFDPGSALCLPSTNCLQSAGRVLALAQEHGVPVLHTRVVFGLGGVDGGVFVRKVTALSNLVGEGPMTELMPEVAPHENELVLVKQFASAFFGTSLASTLLAQGVDTVVIVGVSTSGCVRATAVDAIQHGFIPLVVREAVGDRHTRSFVSPSQVRQRGRRRQGRRHHARRQHRRRGRLPLRPQRHRQCRDRGPRLPLRPHGGRHRPRPRLDHGDRGVAGATTG